jgi:hypothetical protein
MRNDARPIGEDSPASPVGGDQPPVREPSDSRDSVARDGQSRIVNRDTRRPQPNVPDDPTMPSNEAALNTKI